MDFGYYIYEGSSYGYDMDHWEKAKSVPNDVKTKEEP